MFFSITFYSKALQLGMKFCYQVEKNPNAVTKKRNLSPNI